MGTRQVSLASLFDVVTVAAIGCYLMRVAAPGFDEVVNQIERYQYESALSSKFDFALEKQKRRRDNCFTVVIFDRSKWGE